MPGKKPDIVKIVKGGGDVFDVEVVFAEEAGQSPSDTHTYDEILLLLEGDLVLQTGGNGGKEKTMKPLEAVMVPSGTEHGFNILSPIKLLVIHPDRLKGQTKPGGPPPA